MSMIVAVLGARERSSVKRPGAVEMSEDERKKISTIDKPLVDLVLTSLITKFGDTLSIVSYGCDDGVGLLVKDRCTNEKEPIQFAEVIWYFHGDSRSKMAYQKFYVARNACVAEIADMFVLLVNHRRQSMLEDLIRRLDDMAVGPNVEIRPFICIDETNKVVRTNMKNIELYLPIDDQKRVII